jgi:hypothetical protein
MRAAVVYLAALVACSVSPATVARAGGPNPASPDGGDARERVPGVDADALARRAAELQKLHKGHGLTVVVEAPFVIVGDEKPATVRKRATGTLRWAVTMLKQDYFARDPDEIIEVWLFKNEKTYRAGAKKYFGDEPDTPYGYYSPTHRAMIMNIGPGAGTLVHEIVHPYMEANFPEVPAWFNEGLASLYEHSGEENGHIVGKLNWRLRGLHAELKSGHRRDFESLTGTTSEEFYGADDDTYAQARYLVYYLQEKGLLHAFYKEFAANHAKDPTGYKSLAKVLGRDDMDVFYEEWVKWVMKLPEP